MASRAAGLTGVALIGVALALAAPGCGGSGSGTSAGSTAGRRRATEQEVQARGTKGESPTTEAATGLRIAAGDCAALAAHAEKALGVRLDHRAHPRPPLSKCRLTGPGIAINVFLDSAFAAHERYTNRMVETQQFGAPDPGKVPHPVAGVGEKSAYNQDASWVPDYGTLFAVRGNRWITVAYSAAGKDNRESRDEAADLGRLAFRLTAR